MKKAPPTVKHQDRRRRALDRFTIDPQRKNDAEYLQRKRVAYESTVQRLGVNAPTFDSLLRAA